MNRPYLIALATVLAVFAGSAKADHDFDEHDSSYAARRLAQEARQLENVVRRSGLHYQVQEAANRFGNDAIVLADCLENNSFGGPDIGFPGIGGPGIGGPIIVGPGGPGLGGGPIIIPVPRPHGGGCRFQMQRARQSFAVVERYLYDTAYSLPRVHRQYLITRDALRDVANVGPGPGPGQQAYQCTATDNGWEEHAGGHVAYGRNLQQAQRLAIAECQSVHGSCRIRRCDPVQ